jgi:PAS domain S-box-containing protein
MKDENKTKAQLINELQKLRLKISDLEKNNIRGNKGTKSHSCSKIDKQAEKEVIVSEALYHAIIDTRAESIWSIDTNYRLQAINKKFKQDYLAVYDIKLEQGMHALEILPSDQIKFWKTKYDKALGGENESFDFSENILGKDYHYMVILNPIYLDEKVTGVSAIGLNATAQKRAEEALQKSEARLREAQKLIGLGYWDWQIASGDVDWSEKVYTIFGLKPNEFTPQIDSIMKMSPWLEDNTRHLELIKRATENREKGEFEQKFLRPNGSVGYYHSTFQGKYDDKGGLVSIEGTVLDISERRHAEEKLRQLRNYLSNIIDSMPSMLIGVDPDGTITQWNSEAERVTGLTGPMAVGQTLTNAFPRLSTGMELVQAAIKTGKVQITPKQVRQENGEFYYEDVTVYPLVSNGMEGAVIRIDDGTDKVRIEEMMIQSEKMLSMGGLAAGMAHEINNPLAGMMQTAEVMAGRLGTNFQIPANRRAAEAAGTTLEAIESFMMARGIIRMIDTINTAGKRVAAIVENMLSFARKSDATVSSNTLEELLDKTLELAATDYDLKKQYDFKRIEIGRDYGENVPAISCEGAKIQQVLLNILRNGAEAIQKAETENSRFIFRTRLEKERSMVRLEIEDNGPGMDETTRKRVFEPFFTTKPAGVGTGLGLSVSYFIITENHNGEMEVESQPGVGTKFIIRLPIQGK